ncbi:MAG: glycoside hydrolase family 20 zincin-like fold domain-containing protein [Bacteroidota bacterium]
MRSWLLGVALLLAGVSVASAQTDFSLLHPQPRQAYYRFLSAVYEPNAGQHIFLDPAQPMYGAAAVINAFLREKGKDTLAVKLYEEADSMETGVCLGVRSAIVNRMLASLWEQPVQVTADFPGAEGYVFDAIPWRILINGSDEAGLFYGVDTFLKLLYPTPQWWGLEACRIVDKPEFPVRWFYQATNIQVGSNVTAAKALWDRALKSRLNGVHLNDSKFARPTTLPQRYMDSLVQLRDYARDRRLEIIPGVMPIGYSNSLLYHNPNLASGLPVRRQKFVIEADTARLVPQVDVALPNGGFEQHNGDNFPGYRFIDSPGQMSFADTQEKHSGSASIRFENFAQYSPQYGNGRVSYWNRVHPFTEYHVSAWVKTESLQPSSAANISVLSNAGYNLSFNDISLPATTDWRKIDFTFNSLEADTVGIYWGVWGAKSGRIWWDDLVFEETSFVNLIRRPGAPLTLAPQLLTIVYTEGRDFDTLRDARMGMLSYAGNYDMWHTPPTLRVRPVGMLKNGDTVFASYFHTVLIHGSQVMCTMSDPEVYDILDRDFRVLDSVLNAKTYFMQHDEIRTMNWDAGDEARGLSPAAILADNVRQCREIIERHHPGADVWVWTDMFDEYHNAVQGPYYLVRGDLRGSAELIANDVGMVNWNGRDGTVQKSLGFFADRGFRQISAPYYDNDEQQIRRWKEWTRDTPDFRGMMYTTWAQKYDHLEPFGDYAWNHAPYIYHTPPYAIQAGNDMNFITVIQGDPWDQAWTLTDARIHFRTQPGDAFAEHAFTATLGQLTDVMVPIPAGATWLQWYVTASDNRGWTTRVPFADTLFYELGEITTGVGDVPAAATSVLQFYPQPASAGSPLYVQWRNPGATDTMLRLYDLLGREVYAQSLHASTTGLTTSVLRLPVALQGTFIARIGGASRVMQISPRPAASPH